MNIFLNERINLNGGDWIPEDIQLVKNNIIELGKAINTLNFHVDFKLYYSSSYWKLLIGNFETLISPEFFEPLDRLRSIIDEIDAIDWGENSIQRGDINYYYQADGGALPIYVNGTTIAETIEHKHNGSLVAILNLMSSDYNNRQIINVNRSQQAVPDMEIHSIHIVFDKESICQYFKQTRERRVFNVIEKHGENKEVGQWWNGEWASPLKCSGDDGQIFLYDAVGQKNKRELYGYDATRNEFLVFKYEGVNPSNQYHGYYPEKQTKEISEKVRDFLKS